MTKYKEMVEKAYPGSRSYKINSAVWVVETAQGKMLGCSRSAAEAWKQAYLKNVY